MNVLSKLGWLIAGAVWTLIGMTASGQDVRVALPGHLSPVGNAALLYWQAWELGEPLDKYKEASAGFEEVGADGRPTRLSAGIREALSARSGQVGMLISAAEVERADWGVDFSKGVYALLPHLGNVRVGQRLVLHDAMRAAEDGDADGAARRLAAALSMARHVRGDATTISSLVSVAMVQSASAVTRSLAESGGISPSGARRVLAAARAQNDGDPFGMRQALDTERWFLTEWMRAQCAADPKKLREFMEFGVGEPAAALAKMTPAEVDAAFVKAGRFFDAAAGAWGAADAVERLTALEQRKAEFGPIYELFGPALTKAKGKEAQGRRTLDELVAALEKAAR